jgi:hypothetical protein
VTAELAARRTAAAAVLADYRRELHSAPLSKPPGREWMLRLADVLGDLLAALDPVVALGQGQAVTAVGALGVAAEYRRCRASLTCEACAQHPAELCEDHATDLEAANAYDRVAAQIEEAAR